MLNHIKKGDIVLVKDAYPYEGRVALDLVGRILKVEVVEIETSSYYDKGRFWVAFDETFTYTDNFGTSIHNAWPFGPDDLEVVFTT